MSQTSRATLIGCIALLLWSVLAILTKLAGPMPPFQLVAMAFALGALVGLAAIARTKDPIARLRAPPGAWALGVAGLFGYHFFYFVALRLAPAVEANLLNYLWPLLIVLFSALLPGGRLSARHLIGAGLGLMGAILLIAGPGAVFAPRFAAGYGAALVCALVWSGYSVANRRFDGVPSEAVAGFCAATALLATLAHFALEPTVAPIGWQWAAILILGLGPTGVAFYAWDHGCKHGDIRALGTLAYCVPLLSNGLLIAAGQGVLDWRVGAAAILIVGGAALGSGLGRARAEVPAQP
jgi:drug/metabolite transporter (DMT)-like permease